MTDERTRDGIRPLVLSAMVLGLVSFGDALIYVVLPLHAESFGVPLALVGVALSLNRLVRILGYGWLGGLARRFSSRSLMAVAAVAAAASTLAYGLLQGVVALFAARLLWGMSYGVLNVLTTVYAIGHGDGTGRRMGLSRAVIVCGPALSLSLGAWGAVQLGPQEIFVVLGAFGLLAVPLALTLPNLGEIDPESRTPAGSRWRPSSLNLLFFTTTLAVEGIFPMTLSLVLTREENFSLGSALLTAGLVLTMLRLAVIVGSLVGGELIDRVGARRILIVALSAIIVALLAVAAGAIYAGAALIIIGRAVLGPTGALLAARQGGGTKVERLATYATWVDCGLAAGPLIAGILFAPLGPDGLYLLAAAALAVASVGYMVAQRGRGGSDAV